MAPQVLPTGGYHKKPSCLGEISMSLDQTMTENSLCELEKELKGPLRFTKPVVKFLGENMLEYV